MPMHNIITTNKKKILFFSLLISLAVFPILIISNVGAATVTYNATSSFSAKTNQEALGALSYTFVKVNQFGLIAI